MNILNTLGALTPGTMLLFGGVALLLLNILYGLLRTWRNHIKAGWFTVTLALVACTLIGIGTVNVAFTTPTAAVIGTNRTNAVGVGNSTQAAPTVAPTISVFNDANSPVRIAAVATNTPRSPEVSLIAAPSVVDKNVSLVNNSPDTTNQDQATPTVAATDVATDTTNQDQVTPTVAASQDQVTPTAAATRRSRKQNNTPNATQAATVAATDSVGGGNGSQNSTGGGSGSSDNGGSGISQRGTTSPSTTSTTATTASGPNLTPVALGGLLCIILAIVLYSAERRRSGFTAATSRGLLNMGAGFFCVIAVSVIPLIPRQLSAASTAAATRPAGAVVRVRFSTTATPTNTALPTNTPTNLPTLTDTPTVVPFALPTEIVYSNVAVPTTTDTPVPPTACTVTTKNSVNLRGDPSTTNRALLTIPTQTKLAVLGQTKDKQWWNVTYDNGTKSQAGWVNTPLVTPDSTCTSVPIIQP